MNSSQTIELEVKTISDRQSTLFDLDQYECDSLVKWGWLEDDAEIGSSKNLLPNSKNGEQNPPDILLPNSENREQIKPLLPNLEIVKVKGRSYFLTPNKNGKLLPKERSWYDIKTRNGKEYLYLRWREGKTQKSRLLGRIDALKYSD
jgi:hypothetical protein